MANTLHLGASSLTGKSVNALVEEAFGKSEFPLALQLTNNTPRNLVFPDVRAELKPNFDAPGNQIEVTFKDHAQLTRFDEFGHWRGENHDRAGLASEYSSDRRSGH